MRLWPHLPENCPRAVSALALLCAVALLPSAAVSSTFDREVLGAGATVYRLLPLDAEGNVLPMDAEAANALALEIARPGQPAEYLLVPGTDDRGLESAPSLSFFAPSNTLHLVWVDEINVLHSKIETWAFRPDAGFVQVGELVGNPFYAKLRPQIVGTQDRASWTEDEPSGAEGEARSRAVVQRVFHTVWREEQGHVFYSAIAEGASGGRGYTDMLNLSQLLPALEPNWRTGIDGPLALTNGRDPRTVLLTFIDPERRSLESIEISTLPVEMARLADAGHEILSSRTDVPAAGSDALVEAAEEARSHIIRIGRSNLSDPMVGLVGREAAVAVLSTQDEASNSWVSVAEAARSHIVRIGRSLRADASGASPLGALDFITPMTTALDADPLQDPLEEPNVYTSITHLASVALPEAVPAEPDILQSADGRHFILFWEDLEHGAVNYVEFEGGQWSESHTLTPEVLAATSDVRTLFRSRLATSR